MAADNHGRTMPGVIGDRTAANDNGHRPDDLLISGSRSYHPCWRPCKAPTAAWSLVAVPTPGSETQDSLVWNTARPERDARTVDPMAPPPIGRACDRHRHRRAARPACRRRPTGTAGHGSPRSASRPLLNYANDPDHPRQPMLLPAATRADGRWLGVAVHQVAHLRLRPARRAPLRHHRLDPNHPPRQSGPHGVSLLPRSSHRTSPTAAVSAALLPAASPPYATTARA